MQLASGPVERGRPGRISAGCMLGHVEWEVRGRLEYEWRAGEDTKTGSLILYELSTKNYPRIGEHAQVGYSWVGGGGRGMMLRVKIGLQVRAPTNIVSSICDDRGEEPTYNGVTMSTLMTGDHNVGDVISLLWFKRQLPKYATRFIEMCVMLCADHGPCVSGYPPPPPHHHHPGYVRVDPLTLSVCIGKSILDRHNTLKWTVKDVHEKAIHARRAFPVLVEI
jgi:hypothetical protein